MLNASNPYLIIQNSLFNIHYSIGFLASIPYFAIIPHETAKPRHIPVGQVPSLAH
jgi:hypothetical protein